MILNMRPRVLTNDRAVKIALTALEEAAADLRRRKRGARPSRSLCSASRRTAGAADSTHRLVRQAECCQPVGGTPTGAVETTALPIFNCMVPAKAASLAHRGNCLVAFAGNHDRRGLVCATASGAR